jgi:DNA-binding transcriptional MerR regulator
MSDPSTSQQPDSPPAQMTIGELARRTGMTVRNIRAHQTKGLLPPPEVRGRTGYYGEEHVARIALTREMQADGLNLEAIRRLLENADGGGAEILDFTRALRAPYEDEAPEIVEAAELVEVWGRGNTLDPKLMKRAEALGILRALPDGRVEVISPRLQRAGAELAVLGIGPEAALETAAALRRHSERIAATFVDLFVRQIWGPFDRAGRPEEDWPKVREALDQVRPLASSALLAMFQLTMGEATEKASERTLQVAAAKPPRKARKPSQKAKRRRR